MYCVKCGVKLEDGTTSCPLCNTPVWNPEGLKKEDKYPRALPRHNSDSTLATAIILTILSVVSIIVVLVICLNLYGKLSWGGYPIFGILLFDVIFVLPSWFRKPNPVIFVPIDFLAIALYLLYISCKVGGHWFFSFALPIIIILAVDIITVIVLVKYVKKGGLFIAGGALIFLGLASLLIELFETITFHTRMFTWSLYSLSVFVIFGIFLIIAGINKPLRTYLEQHFFI